MPVAALGHVLLHDGRRANHVGHPLRAVSRSFGAKMMRTWQLAVMVWCSTIGAEQLLAILGGEEALDPVASAFRQRVLDNMHAAEGGELVQHHQQPVLVRHDWLAVLRTVSGTPMSVRAIMVNSSRIKWAEPFFVAAAGDDVERHGPLVVHQVHDAEVAALGVLGD